MICDGSNLIGELNGEEFLYRPFTRRDRRAIAEELSRLPDDLAALLTCQIAQDRIVQSTWSLPIESMPKQMAEKLLDILFGVGRNSEEESDEKNLSDGVYLQTRWPHLANVSCRQCRFWWFVPFDGRVIRRDGTPLRRPQGTPTPCEVRPCPKGHYDSPVELSEKNRRVFEHFQTCEAAGVFPDDPIVKRNAEVIRAAIRRAESDSEVDRGRGE